MCEVVAILSGRKSLVHGKVFHTCLWLILQTKNLGTDSEFYNEKEQEVICMGLFGPAWKSKNEKR